MTKLFDFSVTVVLDRSIDTDNLIKNIVAPKDIKFVMKNYFLSRRRA